jgi:hypothetical protein
MTTLLTKNTMYDASSWGAGNVRLRFSTWYDTTSPNDKLSVIFTGNGSTYTPACTYSGYSLGWQEKICTVSSQYLTSQFKFGFLFESDGSPETKQGVYVDDVYLERYASNVSVGNYDDYQESRLQYGPISVSGYTGTVFDFWIKGNIEDCCDSALVELSADGSNWTPVGSIIQTDYSTWQQKQYSFNSLSGNIYFRIIFESDYLIRDSGYYVDDVKVWGYLLLPDGSACNTGSECQSGVCGGAHVDYKIHCNTDGSSTAYGDQRVYVNTCGGAGTLDHTNFDFTSGTCSTNKVCDADLWHYNSTFTTSQICKTSIPNFCSVSPDCWNDNGGVDCKGSSSKICTYGNNGDYCTENAQCNSNQCISNQCSTGIPNGYACSTDSQCASGFCVANVCSASHNPLLTRTDTWNLANSNNVSDENDGHVFVNQSVYPNVTGLREETDMVCYDFDGNGVYDACYFDSNGCGGGGCSANSCNYFTIPNTVQSKYSCDIDSPTGCHIGLDGSTTAKICSGAGCVVNTSQGSDYRQIISKSYTDCDNNSNLRAEVSPAVGAHGNYYYVYHSKYYKAENTALNQKDYWEVGQWGYSDDNSSSYFFNQCIGNTAVDVVAEEFRVTTANGVIPNVCKKIPGETCSSNSECLYNVCSGTQCVLSGGIKGHLFDETGHPIAGKVMKLTTCNDALITQSTTDASGKYGFYAPAGSYKTKTTAPWGEVTFVWANEPSGCHYYPNGFSDVWSKLFTKANIHGRAVNPQGFASSNLPFEAATCQNVVLDTDTSDYQGYFSLNTDTGYQRINVDLNGNKFPITAKNGNACIFQYGDVDLGDIKVTANCSLYNNTCDDSDPNLRLYNCSSSSANGCSCSIQHCLAGCTDGAPQCNVVGTGTIKVSVADMNGNSTPYAEVRSDGVNMGKTNGFGKKDINTQHGPHTVKVTCPNDPISQTKNTYINTNQKYVSFALNCPTPPKGDLKVIVSDVNGLPIVNAHIFLDDSQSASTITDIFGLAKISNIPFGQHSVQFAYKLDFNQATLLTSRLVDINTQQTTVVQTLLAPTDPGYSSYSATEITPSVFGIDDSIVIGTIVVAAVASRTDYCACVNGYSDVPIFNECMTVWGSSNTTTDLTYSLSPFRSFVSDHYNEHLYCESHFMGTIKKIGEFILFDRGMTLVFRVTSPIFFAIDDVIPITSTYENFVSAAKKLLPIKNTSNGAEYTASGVNNYFSYADDILSKPYTYGTVSKLSYSGRNVVKEYADDIGSNGVMKINQFADASDFHRANVSEAFNSIAKLRNSQTISSQALTSVENKLKHDILSYHPGGDYGFSKGSIGESIGALNRPSTLSNKIISSHEVFPQGVPSSGRKVDFVFTDGELYEIKTTVVNSSTSLNSIEDEAFDILHKSKQWQLADPNRLIHVKFTNFVEQDDQLYFWQLLNKENATIGADTSKIILYWDGSP